MTFVGRSAVHVLCGLGHAFGDDGIGGLPVAKDLQLDDDGLDGAARSERSAEGPPD